MNRKLIFGIFILMFLLVGTVSASYVTIEDLNYVGKGNGADNYINTGIYADEITDLSITFKHDTPLSGTYGGVFGATDSGYTQYFWLRQSETATNFYLGGTSVYWAMTASLTVNNTYTFTLNHLSGSDWNVKLYNHDTGTYTYDGNRTITGTIPHITLYIYGRHYGTQVEPNYPSYREIYDFSINGETWNINEGHGDVLIGNKLTELTIQGTLTDFWQPTDFWDQPYLQISSLQKGLVGHWTLDQDNYNSNTNRIGDSSSYENHFTNSGATSTTDRNGNANSAMAFDGSTNYAIINDNFVVSPTELTISAWLKKESGGATYECVLHKSSDATIGNTEFWLGVDSSDLLTATIGARTGVSGTWAAGRTTTTAIYSQWYLLTATWNGTVVKVYLDGEYNKQYALTTYSNINYPTRIGASSNGANYEFKGDIDDVRIYNRALSADEVKLLYESHKPQISGTSLNKGLVGHWTLDEQDYNSNTNKSTDKSAYEHHATNYGTTSTINRFETDDSARTFGTSKYVVIENTNQEYNFTSGEEFSYGAWFYPTTLSSWNGIISKMPSWGNGYNLQVGTSQNIACGIGTYVKTSWAPEVDTWYHAMCVYTGTAMRLYVNGEYQTATTYAVAGGNSDLKLGMFYTTTSLPFYGIIDDVRIYNRALSATEIQQLYHQGR
jgi:hypothetical protein